MRAALGRTLVFVAALALAACADDPSQTKQAHYESGERYLKEGRHREAIVEFRNALKQDEKFGEARLKLAEAYVGTNDAQAALREYVRAADLLPQNDTAQLKAAAFLLLAGKFEDARSRVQPVVDRNPTNVEAQLVLGNALAGLKDLDGAVRELQEAIDLDPSRGLTHSNLAAVHLAQGRKDAASAALQKAVAVDPRSIEAWLALANFQWTTGDLAGVESSLKQAHAVGPTHPLVNRALAAYYIASGKPANAEPHLEAVAATGSAGAVLQLADYYVQTGNFAKAVAVLAPLKKDAVSASQADIRLARIAYLQGDKPGAHSAVDTIIKREPANADARLLKSAFLSREKKLAEARDQAQAAVQANPASAPAHYALGVLQDQLRQRKEAIASFSEVLRLNPRATAAQVYLSGLNLMEGSSSAALTHAELALTAAPDNPDARATLVRALVARRDTARAEQQVAALLKSFPTSGIVHALDGSVRLLKNDVAGARVSFEKALALTPDSTEALAGITNVDLIENRVPQALARLDAMLAREPNRADLLLLAAQAHAARRDLRATELALRKAIEADPTSTAAYSMLAGVLMASGKMDAARVEFDQVVRRDPNNIAARTMAAMLVYELKNTADAKTRYEAILALNPRAAVAANNLSWIYAEEGQNLDEALRLAKSAVEHAPNNADVTDTLGWVYVKMGMPTLAVPVFERSIQQDPKNAMTYYHLALALSDAGDKKRARDVAQQALKIKPDLQAAQRLLDSL